MENYCGILWNTENNAPSLNFTMQLPNWTMVHISFHFNNFVTDGNGSVAPNADHGRLLHHLLRFPRPLRPPHPLHLPCSPERPTLQSHEDCPIESAETLQGEPQVGVQEAERL